MRRGPGAHQRPFPRVGFLRSPGGYACGVDIAFAAVVALGTVATIVGLVGLAILGPREKLRATEVRTMDSMRRRELVRMAQAHSRARH